MLACLSWCISAVAMSAASSRASSEPGAASSRANPEPGAASSDDDQPYPGSRKEKFRYSYKAGSTANFIEWAPEYSRMNEDGFKKLLEKVPGVNNVICHPKGSKEQQMNFSETHFFQHNIFVYSSLFPKTAVESELTRN